MHWIFAAVPIVLISCVAARVTPTTTPQPDSGAFVVATPVFKGWLDDPLIARLAAGAQLDAPLLVEAMRRDPSGDLAIVAQNAGVLLHRRGAASLSAVIDSK